MDNQLLTLLGAQAGHFALESGHHGDLWLDLDALFLHPARLKPFAHELADRLSQYDFDAVCGPLVGGALLAQMIAAALDVEFYHAERSAPGEIDGLYQVHYSLPATMRERVRGKRVALVDDAINAGSAVRATLTELAACGARPVALGALFILNNSAYNIATENNLAVERIAQLSSGLWTPAECPLCAAGRPLSR